MSDWTCKKTLGREHRFRLVRFARPLVGVAWLTTLACAAHEVPVDPTPLCPQGMAHLEGGRLGPDVIDPLCMDITEVTTAAYGACVTDGSCPPVRVEHSSGEQPMCNAGIEGRGKHPINCVDSAQAAAFCTWAGKRVVRAHEWEWAARGRGRATAYPWGDAEVDAVRVCWSGASTCETGSRPAGASPDGVLDLAGNVAEWVQVQSTGAMHVRGGSWRDTSATVAGLAAAHPGSDPQGDFTIAGIRCVVDPHTSVKTIDSEGWTPEKTQAPKPSPLPVVANRPQAQAPTRPLVNLMPMWHHLANQTTAPPKMWPIGQEYIAMSTTDAAEFGLQHGFDIANKPTALAEFEPIHAAGPLVLMNAGWRRSGSFVAVERDSSAIRWQVNLETLGRSYNRLVTPKTLVAELYGRDADVVVGLALVDGSEVFRKTGGATGSEFTRARKMWQDDQRVYLSGDRGLLAFDPTTGKTLWGPTAIGEGCGVAEGEGVLVVENPGEGHRVLDAATGVERRRIQTGVSGACRWGGDAWDGGVAEGAVSGGKLFAFDPATQGKHGPVLRAFDLQSGRQLWKRKGLSGQVLVADHDAVLSDRDNALLVGIDPTTGAPQTEISFGYDIVDVKVYPGGGDAGPLVWVRDEQENEWLLGRGETAPTPEAYTIRGKLIPERETGVKQRHVRGVPIRVGEKRVRTKQTGAFQATGKTLGAVLVSYDGPTSYDDFKGDPYSRTLTRFDARLVVLTGQGTYRLGEIPLYEWWLE